MMAEGLPSDVTERARNVRVVILDVDGVLTDGSLHYTRDGETLKRFQVRDGLGVRLLLDAGIEVAVISARASAPLDRRIRDLGIRHFLPSSRDKLMALDELMARLNVDASSVCFVGDDLLDVPALRAVGLAITVADGHPVVQREAHWVTRAEGGHGAVREVADLVLEAQHGLSTAYDRHLAKEQERARRPAASQDQNSFGVIIPARFSSTRLPGKPLRNLAGRPMVVRVIENARKSGARFVWVATDDQRIARAVEEAGSKAIMTSPRHLTGTDRLAEAVEYAGLGDEEIIVNVQGDEPLLDPALIRSAAFALKDDDEATISTLAAPLAQVSDLFDPNVVKVVTDRDGRASYFSRAPIPWVRDTFPVATGFLRHIGLYAYRVGALLKLARAAPAPTEQAELLEQLRAVYHRMPIRVVVANAPPEPGVDTEADLARVAALLEAQQHPTPGDTDA
jgi:3-deoxy-manno-octulosonate cytidylyltransferase (CMP-KDO synthetase)